MENPVGTLLVKNELNIWEYDEKFVNWLKINSNKYSSTLELSKYLGVYYGFIQSVCNKNNLTLEYNYKKNNSKYKAIYQDYNWCYQKFMIEGLNHKEMAEEAKCSKRVIEKWCQEIHNLTQKYRQENKTLSSLQKDLIIGSMLGDGHIDKRETQPVFIVSHAENQKDYLYYKYNILEDLCNKEPSYIEAHYNSFGKNEDGEDKIYWCQPTYRICTRIHDCFKDYRGRTYTELLKLMNEYSLSIWILDDGYRDNKWELCVAQYTQDDIDFAINKFKQDYGLLTHQSNSDNRYLDFDANSSRKLDEIILKNIPNELDIIQYKIIKNDKIKNKQKRVLYKDTYLSDYCYDNNLDYKSVMGRIYRGTTIENAINNQIDWSNNING